MRLARLGIPPKISLDNGSIQRFLLLQEINDRTNHSRRGTCKLSSNTFPVVRDSISCTCRLSQRITRIALRMKYSEV